MTLIVSLTILANPNAVSVVVVRLIDSLIILFNTLSLALACEIDTDSFILLNIP